MNILSLDYFKIENNLELLWKMNNLEKGHLKYGLWNGIQANSLVILSFGDASLWLSFW